MKIKIAKKEIIHFIGIGGIGMSGLSLIMNSQGFKVQGSDINTNKNIVRLQKEKIQIFLGQSKKNLNKATIVVVSSAIKNDNPELIEAKKRNIPVIKRGEMFGKPSFSNEKYRGGRFSWKNNNNITPCSYISRNKNRSYYN
jgi:UDP-N-acetylmuramate--alanine ligase